MRALFVVEPRLDAVSVSDACLLTQVAFHVNSGQGNVLSIATVTSKQECRPPRDPE